MAPFALEMTVGDRRRARIKATWPVAVPELGVTAGQEYALPSAQKVWFTAKTSAADDDASAVIKKDTSLAGVNDITFGTGATANTAYFDIVEADTAAFVDIQRKVKLLCEVQVKSASGEPWTVAEGELTLKPQIQRSST